MNFLIECTFYEPVDGTVESKNTFKVFFFLRDFILQKKVYMKNFNIKNKEIYINNKNTSSLSLQEFPESLQFGDQLQQNKALTLCCLVCQIRQLRMAKILILK